MSISSSPPVVPGTSIPSEIPALLGASALHQVGNYGQGVNSVIIDSGFYNHPYFHGKGFQITTLLGPGAADSSTDDDGHGTAMAASFLAVAPQSQLTVIKAGLNKNVEAFKQAILLKPHVISCSWGYEFRSLTIGALEKSYLDLIDVGATDGTIMCFAAGNQRMWNFPAQSPKVVAVGGLDFDGLNVTNPGFTSAFKSKAFTGRNVPDLCGITGNGPLGGRLLFPVQPGSARDVELSNEGDGTTSDDGWAVLSGSSSATAQVAGAFCLLKAVHSGRTVEDFLQVFRSTSRQPDGTTGGAGLINVEAAMIELSRN